VFGLHPAQHWREVLAPFNLAVQPLELLADVRRRAIAEGRPGSTVAFLRDATHPSGRVVEHVLPTAIRPARAKLVDLKAAEKYGHSTRRLMAEFGYSGVECEQMLRSGAIAESWSEQYLPD